MLHFDAVVVSDLHLGARNSRGNDFLRFLHTIRTERLIVAGDLFNDARLRGLQERDVQVIDALRRFGQDVRVDWVIGNHDPSPAWFGGLLGLVAEEETLLDCGDRQYLVYHGHGWDPSLEWPTIVVETADRIYSACQWLDPSHGLARRLKRSSKHFCQVTTALERRGIAEAHTRGLGGVICGHSHHACTLRTEDVHYLNTGCWTEKPSTFVGSNAGILQLYDWDPVARTAHPRAGQVVSNERYAASIA